MVFGWKFPAAICLLSAFISSAELLDGIDLSAGNNEDATNTKSSILRGGFHGSRRLAGRDKDSNIESASGPATDVHIDDSAAATDRREATGNDWESVVVPASKRRGDIPAETRALNDNSFVRRSSNADHAATDTDTAAVGRGNIFQRTNGAYKSSKSGHPGPPSPTPQWPHWPGPYPPTPTGGSDHRPHYDPRPPRPR